MKKLGVLIAAAALLAAPAAGLAQDADDGPPSTGIVTMTSMKVPLGADRGAVMEWIEKVVAPVTRVNPNVVAFYVLEHYWGHDSRDVVLVSVYNDWADIEAPCGQPCQDWGAANVPEEGTPEREEWNKLQQVYNKYSGRHSDEIFSARLDLAKN